ncbi:N-acetylmuramoyl-L-alanine amidase [Actinobacillus seminis]|uniref:N-acetylmuramoyl-L-alanine amidase n=1 Tax=Actinobacillus seminis TaxID=722 RepID=A0A263HEI9_9PAST|nr:N-acetylmuramoyl-L-alanine amidase [Actinobacillus seminis]OZN25834.1 N-acetylmuramoyl-L-alanine amidase [Actinobacillus seminis]SUU34661.1 N-acetylmuramoyl-L-alanine amidase [Actinobacillus seminis]
MHKLYSFIFTLFCFFNIVPPAIADVWTIAIDPGHGGKDPGAISRNLKIYEKNVTLAIAKELKALLDKDPNFRAVMTRNGDYYISVPARSEIARKKKANYLVSIHADSSVSPLLRGASVWVLSNRRANDEMGQWLEDDEKRSELLGGAGNVLASHHEKYLDQTVLDLQFGHSQRVGYELGSIVLRHFATITKLSRNTPQHASLGVLRSPDIPSILVETGFLSNTDEEKKLNTPSYRKKIARIIYDSLVEYRRRHVKPTPVKIHNKTNKNNAVTDSGIRHKVKAGESLSGLAAKYKVKINDIITLNHLKRRELWIGETIKIPSKMIPNKIEASNKNDYREKGVQNSTKIQIPKYHTIQKDQTLYAVSREYNIPINQLFKLNPKLKDGKVIVGQKVQLRK